MKAKRILELGLAAALAVTGTSILAACGSGGPTDYTFYISAEDSGKYYSEYNLNPVTNYINDYLTFNGNSIHVEYKVAPSTGAADNLTTRLATGNYEDLMDVSMSEQSILQLYESGAAMDITEYVEAYMPNYLAFFEEHPELEKYAVTYIDTDGDGELEKRYLHIQASNDMIGETWEGFQYRRDWIAKYGTHPEGSPNAGEPFTYSYSNADGTGELTDDITFPSYYTEAGQYYKEHYDPDWDGTDPVFLSDWEWMLGIFRTALDDLGLENDVDSYPISLFFYGYTPTGDLVSAFGGYTNGGISLLADGTIDNTADDENFKEYLKAMNNWYENGWLDTAFFTRQNDQFFQINSAGVTMGKVGMWQGVVSQLGSTLSDNLQDIVSDKDAARLKGAYVAPARQPINDVYGSDEEGGAKFSANNPFIPASFYGGDLIGMSWIVTPDAQGKDMETLFTFLDWLMDPEEGGLMTTVGLSDEQIAQAKADGKEWAQVYDEFGVTSMGTWGEDGMFTWSQPLAEDTDLKTALVAQRFPRRGVTSKINFVGSDIYLKAQDEWLFYENTAYGKIGYLENYMTSEEARLYSQSTVSTQDFLMQTVPTFISGERDIDSSWESFKETLVMYNVQEVEKLLNDIAARLENIG